MIERPNIVGRNVEIILKRKGWTVAYLARLMGKDTKSVYRILKENPQLDSILSIAKALDVAPKMLFEDDDKVYGVIRANGQSHIINNKKDLEDIITYEIIPLLEEYWYDDEDSIIQWKNALDGVIND